MGIINAFVGVKNSGSKTVYEIAQIWEAATPKIVNAAIELLQTAKEFPGVEMTVTNNGVSGYGLSENGKRRECFHIGVNPSQNRIIVYQHGEALDLKAIFKFSPDGKKTVRYGYLTEPELDKIPYVSKVIRESYKNLTGR